MTKINLAIFATNISSDASTENFIAQALILEDLESKKLTCEIHIGKMVARFNPNPDYFLEDVLWQLNTYCQIPMFEIECDVHYPEPIDIEDEYGEEECMQIREEIVEILNATPYKYLVINWPTIMIDEKLNKLKNCGVNIESCNSIHLDRIDKRQLN